ncbi:hypothetical protein ACQJBY_011654 [Aegilops geniculata]
MCTRDSHLWRIRCPLICIYVVEWHLPHRVAMQFGMRQHTPPEPASMGGLELHNQNRRNNQNVLEWGQHHARYVEMWEQRLGSRETDMTLADMRNYKENHLKWYDNGRRFRVRLRPRWTDADLADDDPNNESDDEYDAIVRSTQGSHREYAPLTDRVTFELNRSIIEGSNALIHKPGTPESDATLRETVKRFMIRCQKLVTILGCASPGAVDVHAPSTSMVQASGAAASSSHAGANTSHVGASSSHASGGSDSGESEEEEEVDLQDDEAPKEMNMSQMMDAPPASQAKRVGHPHDDPYSPSPFQKPVPYRRKKTVSEGCSKRGRMGR